jgi:pimeloyl-ACP methyl ester carboxylesterase
LGAGGVLIKRLREDLQGDSFMLIPASRALLPVLPKPIGFWLTCNLADIVASPPVRAAEQQVLARARRIRFGPNSDKVGWFWGTGPLVVLVHGWAGRATQMVRIAEALVARGFEVGMFDVTAHGSSKGRQVTFRDFIDDLKAFCDSMHAAPYAIVAHSAGGLAAAAARTMRGVTAQRYAFIAVPCGPYIPIDEIRRHLAPSESIIERCQLRYARQFDASWEALDAGDAFACAEATPLLLVYDDADPRIRPEDPEIISARWKGSVVVRTQGLGHTKTLWDPTTIRTVADFVASTASGN